MNITNETIYLINQNIVNNNEPMVPYSNCLEYAHSLVKVENAKNIVIFILLLIIAIKIYREYKEKKGRQAP